MSDTPRTDALVRAIHMLPVEDRELLIERHAERLERELAGGDALREAALTFVNEFKHGSYSEWAEAFQRLSALAKPMTGD